MLFLGCMGRKIRLNILVNFKEAKNLLAMKEFILSDYVVKL